MQKPVGTTDREMKESRYWESVNTADFFALQSGSCCITAVTVLC